jgi:three-Cys-motif partner protein
MNKPSFDIHPFTAWPNKPPPSDSDALSEWHVNNYIRLIDYLGKIVHRIDQQSESTLPTYTPHRATYLKLLMTTSYARTFLKVGSAYTSDLRYLDVLSASGLSIPKKRNHPVPGSCFLVPLAHQKFDKPNSTPTFQFNRMWALDESENNLNALRWRHKQLFDWAGFTLPPVITIPGEINEAVPELLGPLAAEREKIRRGRGKPPLYLAFVDNQALDVNMDTIAKIQSTVRADLIIHIPTSSIIRQIRAHEVTQHEYRKMKRFFGNENWTGCSTEDEIAQVYRDEVQRRTHSEFQVIDPVHIRGENHTFSLIVCARTTANSGDKGWVARNEKLAAACSRFDLGKLDEVLDHVLGGQKKITQFFPEF